MNPMFAFWFIVGMSAGAAHARLLWRSSQPPFHRVAWHLPRTLLTGGVLFASAMSGGLLPAVGGWMISYFAAVGIVAMRIPK
jgi:hypothetical protein